MNRELQDSNIPYTVNGEMLIVKADALTYMIDTKNPFTGIAEYFRDDTIIAVKTFYEGIKYGELDLLGENSDWVTFFENGWQRIQEDIEDSYVFHNDKKSKFLTIRGEIEGLYESYYENGQLECREHYFNRKLHGVFKYYDEDGNLERSVTWKNGLLVQ